MKLISSYPRSGSARLRMIICHLLYPGKHDFTTMSKFVPSIDNPQTRKDGQGSRFMVTHSRINCDIYLYRHVGDCLVSEYWFKQKFYPSKDSLERYIHKSNFGEEWRKSVEAGREADIKISFDELGSAVMLKNKLGIDRSLEEYENAVKATEFSRMQSIEDEKGFYYLPKGDEDIKYMRAGHGGQWRGLECAKDLLKKNDGELHYLGLCVYDDLNAKYIC